MNVWNIKVTKMQTGFYQIIQGTSMYDIRLMGKKWKLSFRTAFQKEATFINWFPTKKTAEKYAISLIIGDGQ